MFLRCCSPISSNAISSFPCVSSCTRPETQIPPGCASASRRATMFTPSPQKSVFNDKFAKVDAYAEFDPLILRRLRIVFGHAALNLDGAAYRVDDARKLCQYPVADNPNDPTAMRFYLWLDDGAPKRLPL